MKNFLESEFQSHEKQDIFVANILPHENGSFLDIACGNPIIGNNTYFLEKQLNWSGLAIDLEPIEQKHQWSQVRSSKFFQVDATSQKLTECLNQNLKSKHVDYLSLDVDVGPSTNLTHLALIKVLDAGVSFKCCTLEHESFKYGPVNRDLTRKILHEKNYIMLFESVMFPNGNEWEDWWIDPKYFNQEVLNLKSRKITYIEASEKIKYINK